MLGRLERCRISIQILNDLGLFVVSIPIVGGCSSYLERARPEVLVCVNAGDAAT